MRGEHQGQYGAQRRTSIIAEARRILGTQCINIGKNSNPLHILVFSIDTFVESYGKETIRRPDLRGLDNKAKLAALENYYSDLILASQNPLMNVRFLRKEDNITERGIKKLKKEYGILTKLGGGTIANLYLGGFVALFGQGGLWPWYQINQLLNKAYAQAGAPAVTANFFTDFLAHALTYSFAISGILTLGRAIRDKLAIRSFKGQDVTINDGKARYMPLDQQVQHGRLPSNKI